MKVLLETYRMCVVMAALVVALFLWFLFCALLGLWPEQAIDRAERWLNGVR